MSGEPLSTTEAVTSPSLPSPAPVAGEGGDGGVAGPAPAGGSPGAARARRANERLGRRLVLPGQVMLIGLVTFPALVALYISFTRWSPSTGYDWYEAFRVWSWLSNYDGVFGASFLSAFIRTVLMTGVAVGLEFALGLGIALLFMSRFPMHRVGSVLMLIPMMITPAVAGFIFFLLLQSNGPVNGILSAVVPGNVELRWLSDPTLAPIAVVLADVWQWTPFMFLILLAGLLAVPDDQVKAAQILGASWAQIFRRIVLPIIKPIILIALILRAMEAFKLFDSAWLMTKGGPGEASSTISVKLYRDAFLSDQWSYVAALAIVVMIVVSLAAARAVRSLERVQEAQT
ncbi:MAG: sugar ABC transporter permease [Solirubrobacteraceae bacterium]|nr:sugar ABC transporter permease [Solirubrobacteraceae bacterium]